MLFIFSENVFILIVFFQWILLETAQRISAIRQFKHLIKKLAFMSALQKRDPDQLSWLLYFVFVVISIGQIALEVF